MASCSRSSASLGPSAPALRERDALLERRDARRRSRCRAAPCASSSAASSMLPAAKARLGGAQRFLAGRRHELAEELADLRLGKRAHELRDGAAVLERDDVRDRADVERLRELGVLVGVDLHELDAAAERLRDLVERRARACGTGRTTAPRNRRRRERFSRLRRPRGRKWRW